MANPEDTRKNRGGWWLWLLLAVVVLIVMIIWIKGWNSNTNTAGDSIDTNGHLALDQTDALAITEPNWDDVDLNSPVVGDAGIFDEDITVRRGADYTIFTLGENILFAKDRKEIEANSEAKLRAIATLLKKRFDGAYIGVYGSTDSIGSTVHNTHLARERALAVKNWLINQGAIDDDKISVHSIGEREPIATNKTQSGRQQNRNVQIVVFKTNHR